MNIVSPYRFAEAEAGNKAGVFDGTRFGGTTILRADTDFIHQIGIFDITVKASFTNHASTSDLDTFLETTFSSTNGFKMLYGNSFSGLVGKLLCIFYATGFSSIEIASEDLSSIFEDEEIHEIRWVGDGDDLTLDVDGDSKTLPATAITPRGVTSFRTISVGYGHTSSGNHRHEGLIQSVNVINNLGEEIIEYDFNNGDADIVPNTGVDKPTTSDMTWDPAGDGTYVGI